MAGAVALRHTLGAVARAAGPRGRCRRSSAADLVQPAGLRLRADRPAGLASVGVDGRVVREMLGILAWSVVGISGGGPYAVASPAADPGGVLRAMVVAGIGPWTLFAGPQPFENERPFHQMAGRGEIDAAWSGLWDIDPADVTCPVSLVHGKTDPVCPPQHGEWYQPPFVRHVLLLSRNDASGRSAGA